MEAEYKIQRVLCIVLVGDSKVEHSNEFRIYHESELTIREATRENNIYDPRSINASASRKCEAKSKLGKQN